jgi:hypothetical protein
MKGESLWPRLAGLPLVIEACEYERLHAVLAYEFERITTRVRLVGAGVDGLGRTSPFREDGTALHETRRTLLLEGEWTLAAFCEHLETLELWPEPPEWDGALRFRRWAFESAALDLALRQAGHSLHDVLGLEPKPVRFVNSLGLGKEPSIEPLRRRSLARPACASSSTRRRPGRRRSSMRSRRRARSTRSTSRASTASSSRIPRRSVRCTTTFTRPFPTPIWRTRTTSPRELSGSATSSSACPMTRRSEAPTTSARRRSPPALSTSSPRASAACASCSRSTHAVHGTNGRYMAVVWPSWAGHGQIQLFAALFHADAPNDVAPSGYNEEDPPGDLPASPLTPRPEATGSLDGVDAHRPPRPRAARSARRAGHVTADRGSACSLKVPSRPVDLAL